MPKELRANANVVEQNANDIIMMTLKGDFEKSCQYCRFQLHFRTNRSYRSHSQIVFFNWGRKGVFFIGNSILSRQIVVVIGSIGNVIKLCREFKSKDSSQFVLAFMLAIILVLLMLRKLRGFCCVTISKASKLYHSVHTINNYRILSSYDAYKTRKIVFKFRIETFNRFLPIKVCNLTFYNIYK